MSIADALARGRAAAEAIMRDTCRITAPDTGGRVFDPSTGKYTDPAPTTVYEGKCRIPRGGGSMSINGAGDQAFGVGEYPLDLPASVSGVAVGQTVTYLTAPDNPALVGMVFGISEPLLQSQSTKQRFKIKSAVAQ